MTICCISFHPCRSIMKQIWPCHKNEQGQPSVIIWKNLVVLEYPILHTKIQGHQVLGSEERDFWRFLHIWVWKISWSYDPEHLNIFYPNIPWRHNMKFGFNRLSVFWGKEFLKCLIWVTLDKGKRMTLTFEIHKGACTNLGDCSYQLWYHRLW